MDAGKFLKWLDEPREILDMRQMPQAGQFHQLRFAARLAGFPPQFGIKSDLSERWQRRRSTPQERAHWVQRFEAVTSRRATLFEP